MTQDLKIVQVSTRDRDGGAERVAYGLFSGMRQRGYPSYMAVGEKRTGDPDVYEIPNDSNRSRRYHYWHGISDRTRTTRNPAARAAGFVARRLAEPIRSANVWLGIEDFDYPGTRKLLEIVPSKPDIVHLHNLHGYYFDARELPQLTHSVPTVITLHDMWNLTGHCAHAINCNRWRLGCGHCPDLNIGQPIRRDATAFNWRRKRGIFRRSRLYVATPCQWLMDAVNESIMAPGIVEGRVIPNGIDLQVYRKDDKAEARKQLGLPRNLPILLSAAYGIKTNPFKDFDTIRKAVEDLASRNTERIVLVALGADEAVEQIGSIEVRYTPFATDPNKVATYYQAADIFLHAARADTFPNTILESLACGTPVIATGVGGIPEQIRSADKVGMETATGIVVPTGDGLGMAEAINRLLGDAEMLAALSSNASEDAHARFDINRQLDAYLAWYDEIVRTGIA